MNIWSTLNKFAPLALIAGYAVPYSSKGWDRILTDLSTITIDKLQSKWMNLAIAAGCGGAIYMMRGLRLPTPVKTLGTIALYFVLSYNVALAIDPPAPNRQGVTPQVTYVRPSTYNPYSLVK
jgi:hypothetical protein